MTTLLSRTISHRSNDLSSVVLLIITGRFDPPTMTSVALHFHVAA